MLTLSSILSYTGDENTQGISLSILVHAQYPLLDRPYLCVIIKEIMNKQRRESRILDERQLAFDRGMTPDNVVVFPSDIMGDQSRRLFIVKNAHKRNAERMDFLTELCKDAYKAGIEMERRYRGYLSIYGRK